MKRILIFLTALSFLSCNSAENTREDPMIFLENDSLKAGFLPGVGGRLVFLARSGGGENLLKSDSAQWRENAGERIDPTPKAGWKAYGGHIIWPGPQSEWWIHQELNEKRRSSGSPWPPDPYLVYSKFKVLEQTSNSLILEGPPSPITGISFTKKYTIKGSCLEIEVTMINRSDVAVSWDIWSNARFDGNTAFFVPGCENGVLRISGDESGKTGGLDGEIVESAFTFVCQPPGLGKDRRHAKAYLHPDQGKIVAVRKCSMMVMSFDYVERDQIHPEQGFVEIYKMISPGGKEDLLELEHHSAYVNLQPGESHILRENWFVHEYPGGSSLEEAIAWYRNMKSLK